MLCYSACEVFSRKIVEKNQRKALMVTRTDVNGKRLFLISPSTPGGIGSFMYDPSEV